MKSLVRGSAVLSLIGMFVVFIYAHSGTEAAFDIANDSQLQLNSSEEDINTEEEVIKQQDNKKKLVEKTVMSKAAGISKGSFVATAYCLKGRTAMGHGVRSGLIAADPRVLGLGSRVNLNVGGYSGNYLVSDTGGKIKGRRIDIWMASCSEARRFGRRNVTITSFGR
ncbi:MAG: 3D domain-containing protein [Pyrinomonadaceae bacterium]